MSSSGGGFESSPLEAAAAAATTAKVFVLGDATSRATRTRRVLPLLLRRPQQRCAATTRGTVLVMMVVVKVLLLVLVVLELVSTATSTSSLAAAAAAVVTAFAPTPPTAPAMRPIRSRSSSSSMMTRKIRTSSSSSTSTSQLFVSTIPIDDGSGLSYAERSRPYRRTFYTQSDWEKHRSPARFTRNLLNILRSGLIRQVFQETVFITVIAISVCTFNALGIEGYDDFAGIHHDPILPNGGLPLLSIPNAFFTLSSPALSLLLVFKTNTSYGRWDEARKAWGLIVNSSRSIMRQCTSWIQQTNLPLEEKHRLMARLATAIWCFPRSLTNHVLSKREDEISYNEDCYMNLRLDLAEDLIKARHKPTRALYELSCAINELPFSDIRRCSIDNSVNILCDALGANDRILSSPVPLVYTRHTARFLEVWLLLLPFGLWKPYENTWNHWAMIPATVIISFFLLGIEELGIQLEEPFSVLPLHKITNGIGLSAEEHVQWMLNDEKNGINNGDAIRQASSSSSSVAAANANAAVNAVNGASMRNGGEAASPYFGGSIPSSIPSAMNNGGLVGGSGVSQPESNDHHVQRPSY